MKFTIEFEGEDADLQRLIDRLKPEAEAIDAVTTPMVEALAHRIDTRIDRIENKLKAAQEAVTKAETKSAQSQHWSGMAKHRARQQDALWRLIRAFEHKKSFSGEEAKNWVGQNTDYASTAFTKLSLIGVDEGLFLRTGYSEYVISDKGIAWTPDLPPTKKGNAPNEKAKKHQLYGPAQQQTMPARRASGADNPAVAREKWGWAKGEERRRTQEDVVARLLRKFETKQPFRHADVMDFIEDHSPYARGSGGPFVKLLVAEGLIEKGGPNEYYITGMGRDWTPPARPTPPEAEGPFGKLAQLKMN